MKTMSKNKYFLRLVTVVISVILIFSTIGLSTGDQVKFNSSRDVTYLSVVPTSQTVGYGETFSIIVHLNPGEPVIGVQIDLSFDPTLVQVDSVSKADPIWDFFGPPIIDNDAGEITGAGVAVFGTTVTTPTDCFNITFTAQNIDGTSPLTLHDVIVTDQNAEPINPIITNGEVIVGGPINLPPEFGAPSPTNGSTGQPLSFTWSIPISDPEGDSFDWSIECSNGQTNSATGASNGTKTLSLSDLDYLTTYTVWVNATDPEGSGEYTRAWYTFTTEEQPPNDPPEFGTPSPTNGSTGQPLSFTWSIPISDPEGDSFDWSIECSNGQTNSATGASNGTKTLSLSDLDYLTTYTVWVNATDPEGSGEYTRAWYTFTTEEQPPNDPPEFGTPSPTNGSTGQPLSFTWSIPISDPEGDSFDWSIECNNGQTNSGSDASNGTKTLTLSGLDYLTTYTVWVNATDSEGSGEYTRAWYIFTTEPEGNLPPNTPNKPSGTKLGLISTTYTYTTSAIDPNNDQVYYMWNWGDGSQSNWLGPFNSGQLTQANHAWTNKGLYQIKVKAKDVHGAESDWSEAFTVTMFQSVFFIGSIRNVNKTGDYITFEPKLVLGFWSQPFKVNIYTSGLMLVSKDSSGFVGDRFIFGRFYATPSVPINVIDFVSETTFNDAKPVDIQPYLNR